MPISRAELLLATHKPMLAMPPIVRRTDTKLPDGVLPPAVIDAKGKIRDPYTPTIPTTPVRHSTTALPVTVSAAAGAGARSGARISRKDEEKMRRAEAKSKIATFASTDPTRMDVKKYFKDRVAELDAMD